MAHSETREMSPTRGPSHPWVLHLDLAAGPRAAFSHPPHRQSIGRAIPGRCFAPTQGPSHLRAMP
eukprot:1268599-Alexandrium_andersonii.AAC.1